jgi:hypothetical protein
MNTALIVEPRDFDRLPLIIGNLQKQLGESWKCVFYCGKGLKAKWLPLLDSSVEIRELDTNNLTAEAYSDILKTKELWESLYGDFVLVFQADTWILSKGKYTIDFFINKNVSYIGGNMQYTWLEHPTAVLFRNYNGGLSLRKRKDMLEIIKTFPPIPTRCGSSANDSINGMAEDVYFTRGCCNLNLPMGDSEEDYSHFAIHTIFYEEVFGIHRPCDTSKTQLLRLYPEVANSYI